MLLSTLAILSNILVSAGLSDSSPMVTADSIAAEHTLEEFTIDASGPKKTITATSDGHISIDAGISSDQPAFMGVNDPVVVLRSMPYVATSNDLSAAVSVKGSDPGDNIFESDGARIINPMHMLGLFSTFNPAFYRHYGFRAGRIPATESTASGGLFSAVSLPRNPDTSFALIASAGLIESHAAIRTPLKKNRASLSLAFRQTYLNEVFPNLLKLGSSTLDYSFTDINAHFCWTPDIRNYFSASFFVNLDNMGVRNSINGDKEGDFGWRNIAAAVLWKHRSLEINAAYSYFKNDFNLEEGGKRLYLPSEFSQASIYGKYDLKDFQLSTNMDLRHSSGQGKVEIANPYAFEWNLAGNWHRKFFNRIDSFVGLNMAFYSTPGFIRIYPQPRINLIYDISDLIHLYCAYGRYVMTDVLIQETTAGLPADFRINTSGKIRPKDVNSFDVGFNGRIPYLLVDYDIGGYCKLTSNASEYCGALVNFVNDNYSPLDDVIQGHGYSAGLSLSLMRQFGNIRGRISYNFGISRLKLPGFGDDYIPSSYDRPHDFTATVSWTIIKGLDLSASFTHATGLPFTRAKYGYLIGENLICEYFPHNSSRLPDYNRLDLSATWMFLQKGRMKHSVNVSVYNAAACHNVLFQFTTYSLKYGIQQKQSVMHSVIPSVTYTLELQ